MALPNYESCGDSPQFADDRIGVGICFAGRKQQAVFLPDNPWPVFGTYQVGKDTLGQFGTDIASNIVVVVTHKESKAVFTGRVVKDFPVQPPPPPSPVGGIERTGRTSYFNFDLKAQCRISPQPGKYWAVVFLGKLVSNALEFEVQ
ncbi:MAG: hypothetical protein ACYSUP_00135 [Planctomycetota bacterium]